MHTVELDSFPEGNPFQHDALSCGMDLNSATTIKKLEGVYVMANGMNMQYDFYIVDSVTGERIGIKLNRAEV